MDCEQGRRTWGQSPGFLDVMCEIGRANFLQ